MFTFIIRILSYFVNKLLKIVIIYDFLKQKLCIISADFKEVEA